MAACVPVTFARGQADAAPRSAIRIVASEGSEVVWTDPDSLAEQAAHVADSLRRIGYYFAHVEQIRREDGSADAVVTRGPRVKLGAVRVSGVAADLARRLESILTADSRTYFDSVQLEEAIERVLVQLEREGHPLAQAEVASIEPIGESQDRLALTVSLEPGPVVPLKRIEVPGAERTTPELIARLTELEIGELLTSFHPELLRSKIDEAGLFETVGRPELLIDADTTAILRISVVEGDPGTFDLVLGYLPPDAADDRGRIVGNGHLALRNLFGRGRMLSVRLSRLPDQASSIDVSASDPYLLGLPLGIEVGFHGLEQDSTYGKRSYRGEVDYSIAAGMDVIGGFSREVTAPGQAGLRLGSSGRQVIPAGEAWFLGLGVRISMVDRAVNPSRGMYVEMVLESGRKARTERLAVDADTSRSTVALEQRRLKAAGRYFVPTFARQVVVIGGDAGVLLSSEYDRSDLFRIGGATSLRGYDEDRFLGSFVGRALMEYRFLIDPVSYAYAFFDLGYVDRPNTPDLEAVRSVHPGYGIGIQFKTTVGLINVSAAMNPSSGPTDARIHAGLSFGL